MRAHTKGYTRAHTMYYTGAHQVQHADAHQELHRALKDGGSSPYTCRSSEDVSTEHSIEAHTADKPDDIEHPTSTTAALVAALKLSAEENMHTNPSARRSTAARSRTRGPGGFNTKYYAEPLRIVRGEQHGLASCARSRLSLRSSIGQICTLATRPRPRA